MFYYPNVLQRHTGCFSTIWLAATRGIQVTRREMLRVNVKLTCVDIVKYVTSQVPSLGPNQPKPRFSLYLSSQLQYGVVVVYHRQCSFLLEEIQQIINRLLRRQKSIRIDMDESERVSLDLPDVLHMMEEAEGAQDPFFGRMDCHQFSSPYKQINMAIEELALQQSLAPSPRRATSSREGFTSSPMNITLTEKEQFVINAAEYFEGDEIPEATTREIDLLMDQPDDFLRVERDHGVGSSVDQLKETLGVEQDGVWLPSAETGQAALEVTPPHVAMPTPPGAASEHDGDRPAESRDEEVVVPPRRKHAGGRRRQLVFADPEVQIPDEELQDWIGNCQTETLDLSQVLLDVPAVTGLLSPAQLFSAPCGSLIHADLLSLWKQQATLTVLPGSGERSEAEGDSDMEILRTERKRRHSRMKESHSESGLQPAEGSSVSDVILDSSKEDRSVSGVISPASRWSPQEEVHPPLEPIAEENIEMPKAQPDTEDSNMLSSIISAVQRLGRVTFASLLPPQASRLTAALKLDNLLKLASAQQVAAHQAEPYGSIIIIPVEPLLAV
ncbi:REC8 meiotic recombination protein b [Cololabis saira]|uniref:REC8 meiotic recombination protein b n=1 Tax=Cololabis saira TaxID=129043 RepID=UPI002AD3822E|nr:REC8 meiotic recombination protein b [Cololabis saira]